MTGLTQFFKILSMPKMTKLSTLQIQMDKYMSVYFFKYTHTRTHTYQMAYRNLAP